MKNYSVNSVLGDLGSTVNVQGKVLHIERDLGIGSWGKVDFLKRSGYSVVTKY